MMGKKKGNHLFDVVFLLGFKKGRERILDRSVFGNFGYYFISHAIALNNDLISFLFQFRAFWIEKNEPISPLDLPFFFFFFVSFFSYITTILHRFYHRF